MRVRRSREVCAAQRKRRDWQKLQRLERDGINAFKRAPPAIGFAVDGIGGSGGGSFLLGLALPPLASLRVARRNDDDRVVVHCRWSWRCSTRGAQRFVGAAPLRCTLLQAGAEECAGNCVRNGSAVRACDVYRNNSPLAVFACAAS